MSEPQRSSSPVLVALGTGVALLLFLLAAEAVGLYLMHREMSEIRQELARTQAEYADAVDEARPLTPGTEPRCGARWP